jgi:NHLM bacteriocin system ABC transporter ATP-binding protein
MTVDLGARAEENHRVLTEAYTHVRRPLQGTGAEPRDLGTPAADACAVVAELAPAVGVEMEIPPDLAKAAHPLETLLRRCHLRTREVELAGDWPSTTAAPMVGFRVDGGPVSLLPRGRGYEVFDPQTGRRRRIQGRAPSGLQRRALTLHRRLPGSVSTVGGLLRFAFRPTGRDALVVLGAGLAAALLGLVAPIAIGVILPHVLSSGGRSDLPWLAGGVAVVAGAVALLLVARNAAVIRLQGHLQTALEPAVWDRLLDLEPRFFARSATGDLVQRAHAIAEARRSLSDVAIGALLGAFFSASSLMVVFAFDWRLALLLVVALMALVAGLVSLVRRQQRYEAEVFRMHGRVYGLLYPVLLGIDKIQTAGREIQAFALWARLFRRQKLADAETLRYQAAGTALIGGAQPLLLAVLLGGIAGLHLGVSVEHLIVAGVAVGQVVLALGQVGHVTSAAFAIAPILARLEPVLHAPAESLAHRRDPGRLRGAVELDGVTFTYPGSVAPAIHDVSIRAEPGEFIALVGPSGAGKSTVIRLLLGFETPTSGRVSYDDRDLAEVDVRLVRRQLGVILQRVRLVRGSLLDNILASTPDVDEAAAWQAAELAGIAGDILRLPLGMQTRVGEDNQTFSGGQVQRLLIARALVRQPAVLLFDEATSALDNTTQREVCDRIADLACTRIVIAHRLSTIRRADRIYVIEGGRVVGQGTYAGLTARDGTFARLIERQELSCPTP